MLLSYPFHVFKYNPCLPPKNFWLTSRMAPDVAFKLPSKYFKGFNETHMSSRPVHRPMYIVLCISFNCNDNLLLTMVVCFFLLTLIFSVCTFVNSNYKYQKEPEAFNFLKDLHTLRKTKYIIYKIKSHFKLATHSKLARYVSNPLTSFFS